MALDVINCWCYRCAASMSCSSCLSVMRPRVASNLRSWFSPVAPADSCH